MKLCGIIICKEPHFKLGLCKEHYFEGFGECKPKQIYSPQFKAKTKAKVKCKVILCIAKATCKGYCQNHYRRWKDYGDPLFVKRQKK